LARNTVERFARNHDIWRVTTGVMDENKQAMIEADEFGHRHDDGDVHGACERNKIRAEAERKGCSIA